MAEKKVIALKVKVDTSEAIPEIEEIKVQIDELKKANAKMAEELKQGFKAAEQGTKGLGSSIGSLIKSLGIIGVAMKVFEFMKDLLLKNQKVLDAVNVATTALEILFNKLFEAVEPIGDAMKSAFEDPMKAIVSLKDFIVERFMIAMKGFGDQFIALGSIIESALEFDWDGVTKGAEDFGDALLQTFTATTKAERQGRET